MWRDLSVHGQTPSFLKTKIGPCTLRSRQALIGIAYDPLPPHCQTCILKEYLTILSPCSKIFSSSQLSIKLQNQIWFNWVIIFLLSHIAPFSQIYKCQTGQLADFWLHFALCPFHILCWKHFVPPQGCLLSPESFPEFLNYTFLMSTHS